MAKTKVIEVKGLKKSFIIGGNTYEIIKGADLEIQSGDFVVFYGPSGCGKSTLLNLCSGLETPTEGKILVRGEDISKLNSNQKAAFRQSKVGIVFQSFNLLKTMSIQENVALPLIAAASPRGRAMKRAANLLTVFGLAKHLHKIPTEVSGGQQQRVALARALASNPWILVCDEPTGNLDSKSSAEVMEIIYHLNVKSKRTILLVTHNPEHLAFANRIFYLKDGTIEKKKMNHHRPKMKGVADFNLSSHALSQS